MKNIIIGIVFGLISFSLNAQKGIKDSTQMSIPYTVVKTILVDLNEYDRLKNLVTLNTKEISELNSKIKYLNKVNEDWTKNDSISKIIFSENREKIKIYKEDNDRLRDENKRLKTKNTLFSIISGAIIVPLTYVAFLK